MPDPNTGARESSCRRRTAQQLLTRSRPASPSAECQAASNPWEWSEVVPVVWTKFRPFLDGAAGCPRGGPKAAIHSGLESALGSHPCVALSSYQAPHFTAVADDQRNKTIHS